MSRRREGEAGAGDPPAGDLAAEVFRDAAHRVADLAADYLEGVEAYPVLPAVAPGAIRAALPADPPEEAEPMDVILADYKRLIEPHVTHWNHPGFMAYIAISGSGPGILGETLAAALNVNAMLWRTSPAATELEETVCDWLRRLVGLPGDFVGHINDTASMSTFLALGAARHHHGDRGILRRGMAGRPDLPAMTVYASEQAHSSVDKAVLALGLGLEQLRKVPVDDAFRMQPEALARMIAEDREAGMRPIAVVATLGTTASNSLDPVAAIAELCAHHDLWLHVDAAYAGAAAACPELRPQFAGWERADSIVINPHKWLFTPVDCSVLLARRPERLRQTFSLVPDYLQTTESGVTNLMDYGVQLGRRFRSLKLWMVLRAFGARGIRERIRFHNALAQELAGWIQAEPGWELSAPVPFSGVCFRSIAAADAAAQDRHNEAILERVNQGGEIFLSPVKLRGRAGLKLAIGNIRTGRRHVTAAWKALQTAAGETAAGA